MISCHVDNNVSEQITGIVYFNYEVAHTLYSLLLFSPIDACSYIGIDSGASPLCVSFSIHSHLTLNE